MLFIVQARDLAISGVSVIATTTADTVDVVKKDILGCQSWIKLFLVFFNLKTFMYFIKLLGCSNWGIGRIWCEYTVQLVM